MKRSVKYLIKFLVGLFIMTALFSPSSMVFAAKSFNSFAYQEEAKKLNSMGFFDGIETKGKPFNPGLDIAATREASITMLVKLFGMEKDVNKLNEAKIKGMLAGFSDASNISASARKYIAYAASIGMISGGYSGKFIPKGTINSKDLCMIILNQLGYMEGMDYQNDNAVEVLSQKGGITSDEAKRFKNKALTRDDLAGILYGTLNACYYSKGPLLDNLLSNKIISIDKAVAAGVLEKELKVTGIAESTFHFLAITEDGSLWVWGLNQYGQLGDGTYTERKEPIKVMTDVIDAAADSQTTLVLKKDGTVWACGSGEYGELGTALKTSPKPLKVIEDCKAISICDYTCMAIKKDGSLWGWGSSYYKADNKDFSPIKIMENVKQVSCSSNVTLALKEDGSLYGWGSNLYGQLGNDGKETSRTIHIMDDVASICSVDYYSLAVKNDGDLWFWGGSNTTDGADIIKKPQPIKILDHVKKAAALSDSIYCFAVKDDGSLWQWNAYSLLTTKEQPHKVMNSIKTVAAGYHVNLAIKTNGQLISFADSSSNKITIRNQTVKPLIADKGTTITKDPVHFSNSTIEAEVRRIINRPEGAIDQSDMDQIKSLVLNQMKISDISDLKMLRNLAHLELGENSITDISALKGLKNLAELGLGKNNITDISALKELTNLTSLDLNNNHIIDIVALKDLKKLFLLDLSSNAITDISALKNLVNLARLSVSMNKITNLDSISNIGKMQSLTAYDNHITNISGIKNLVNLISLNLNDNRISDITPLKGLLNLQTLSIGDNSITSIDSIKNLRKLTTLDIYYNKLTDIAVLSQMNSLQSLTLKENPKIRDYSPIRKIQANLIYYKDFDIDQIQALADKIYNIADQIIKPGMTDLDKEMAVHDYIVTHTKYDWDYYRASVNQNTEDVSDVCTTEYGVLLDGIGICQSYSVAFKLLLRYLDIESYLVVGTANGAFGWGDHAWNIVNINGKYYQVDVTFDDSGGGADFVSHEYFNISDEKISMDHKWDMSMYPKCTGN